MKPVLFNILIFILCIITLCSLGIYNGFPFVFNSDTAVYLEEAYYKVLHPERPAIYGLFLQIFSLDYSLWLVILTQAMMITIIIFLAFKHLGSRKVQEFRWYFLTFILIVSLGMGASFNVSRLMADVFTPVCVISVGILLFGRNVKLIDRILLILFTLIGVSMHNTNMYVCIGSIFIVWLINEYSSITNRLVPFKKFTLTLTIVFNGLLFSVTIHYLNWQEFKTPRGGAVFLFANMVEMGIVDQYLKEHCEKNDYKICEYKKDIPNNFLWADNSPMNKTGGWVANEQEYKEILIDILKHPKYLFELAYKSILLTGKQFFMYDIGGVFIPSERIDETVRRFFPDDFSSYMSSKQHQDTSDFQFINYTQNVIVGVSFLFIFIVLVQGYKTTNEIRLLCLYILIALLVNAFICGTVSGAFFRYQNRLVWLLPLPLFIHLSNLFYFNKSKREKSTPSSTHRLNLISYEK